MKKKILLIEVILMFHSALCVSAMLAPSHLVSCFHPTPPLSCRDTFLRSLAATQWEKKRRSKHLSQSRLSSSDDVITPSLQPAGEGVGVPSPELSPQGKSRKNTNMTVT